MFKRALVVEDDASHALLIRRALATFADDIVVADRVAIALEELGRGEFDIIISDLKIPDTQGLQHIGKLLGPPPFRPLIVLTSSSALADAIGALQLGARDFLVKDFGPAFKETLGFTLGRVCATLELEREKRTLEREMLLLRAAIEQGQDALAILTPTGDLRYANRAFQSWLALFESGSDELWRVVSEGLVCPELESEPLSDRLARLSSGALWDTEASRRARPEDSYRITFMGMGDPKDAASRAIVVAVRDISDLKRRERFQREILSTTTHDLKGPLGAISISAELLLDMTEGKARELVLRLSSSAQGALNLIAEFLSAQRLKEGNLVLRPAPVQAEEFLELLLADFQTIARARGIKLSATSNGSEARPLVIDKLGMIRAIGNLLSNALKFTPREGSVAVNLFSTDQGIRIQVSDTGPGLAPHELAKLFERFSRLEKHHDVSGTGLGLYVVKCMVVAHGGRIEVESTPGHGTTFTIHLPQPPPINERGELLCVEFG